MEIKSNQSSLYDHLSGFYRPGLSSPEQLVAMTVGREEMLSTIRSKLLASEEGADKPNFMIMGPPGVGKTHFIRVLAELVQLEHDLKSSYSVIQFPEENHRILTFADLLLGIVEILGHISTGHNWQTLYENLIEIDDDTALIDKAIPELEKYCEKKNLRLLIFLENIDVFFRGQLKDNKNLKQFKRFVTKSPFATFIGTSQYNLIKTDELRKAPFNLFDIQILSVLDDEQTVELIKKNLEWHNRYDLLDTFDDLLPRLKALYEMSGGNPRLSLILYELIAKENKWDIKRQIEKLLDETTPFFRERIKSLAPQERALLETISLVSIEQKTAGSIAKSMRQSLQQTSSHLNKLLKAGYLIVADHPTDKRSKIYRIKEGFFGLWLAIGHSRDQNTILPRLVEFMEQWYAEKIVRERKRQQIWNSINEGDTDSQLFKISNQELLLKYLSDIGDKEEKAQSKYELAVYFISDGKIKESKNLLMEIYKLHYEKPLYFSWMLKKTDEWVDGDLEPALKQIIEDILNCWKLKNLGEFELLSKAAFSVAQNLFVNKRFQLIESFIKHIIDSINDANEIIVLLERVASAQEKLKQWGEAINTWNDILIFAKETGDLRTQRTILNNISQIYQDLGDNNTALRYLHDALSVLKKIKDFDGQGTTLNNLATIYFDQGYYEKALECLEQALNVAKNGRNLYIEGITQSNISLIYQARGDYERALDVLENSLVNMKKLGNRKSECVVHNNISQIHLSAGNFGAAIDSIHSALLVAKEDDNHNGIAVSLFNRGKILIENGKEKDAIEDLVTSYIICKDLELTEILQKLDKLIDSLDQTNQIIWKDRLSIEATISL